MRKGKKKKPYFNIHLSKHVEDENEGSPKRNNSK